jgi:hypothetical protein
MGRVSKHVSHSVMPAYQSKSEVSISTALAAPLVWFRVRFRGLGTAVSRECMEYRSPEIRL